MVERVERADDLLVARAEDQTRAPRQLKTPEHESARQCELVIAVVGAVLVVGVGRFNLGPELLEHMRLERSVPRDRSALVL